MFGLAIITFIFVMDFIFRYLDLFIGKGVAFLVVLEFFILSLGHMFALIIPMAVMPATLMAFGQLASENEVTALKASGISLYRMLWPVVAASAVLTMVLVYYQNWVLPESNHKLMNLMMDIGKMKPTLEIKENIFSEAIDGYTILVREKDDRTGTIKDIQIFERKKGGMPTTIVAERGTMTFREEENVLRFELEEGEIHEMPDPRDINTYRKTHFKHFTLNIKDTDRTLKRSDRKHRGDREMSSGMMKARVREIEQSMELIRGYMHQVAVKHTVRKLGTVFPELADPAPDDEAKPPPQEPKTPKKSSTRRNRPAELVLNTLENENNVLQSNISQIHRYGVEIHKKYSIPFSCIIFVLLGAPLAIRSGKKGMTMSIGFSIFFFLIYYIFLISGEKLADRKYIEPWIAMWLPNIILFVTAALLIYGTVRETRTIDWDKFKLLKRWRGNSL